MQERNAGWPLWLFAASALAYLALLGRPASAAMVGLKVAPIACLLYAVLLGRGRRYRTVALALVFCAAGDISLALGHFTPGLGAFLAGHLCYLTAFLQAPRWSAPKVAVLACLGACLAGLLYYLAPRLGEMAVPVYCYILVILAMATAAIAGRDNHMLIGLGAVLFLISDALIAVNRFGTPVPAAAYWIMATYYGAQWLLTRDARIPGVVQPASQSASQAARSA